MGGLSYMFLLFSTLKISSSVTKSSCTLLTVSIDHMKLFITCRFFILPSEPPTFVKKPPSKIIVDKGSVLSLCCEAVGSPPPKVEWLRAGNVRSADTSLAFQEQGCLELNTVEFNSHRKYVCRARNRIGLAETTTSVVVKRKGAF